MRLTIAFLLLTSPFATAEEKSWKGELVLPTETEDEVLFWNVVEEKVEYFEYNGRRPIKVRDQNGKNLRIHDGEREGWVLQEKWVLLSDAPEYFGERLKKDPEDLFALYSRGLGWNHKGDYDKAIKDYTECIRLKPTVGMFFNARGWAWSNQNEYGKAIKDFDEAIRLDPKESDPLINRGILRARKKDFDKAIEDFDEAVRVEPTNSDCFCNRGYARHLKKEYDKAIEDYNEAIRLDPKYAYGTGNRALAYAKLKKYEEAVADFEKAIKLDAMDWLQRDYALFLASCPEAKYRDGAKALKLAKSALDKAGKNADWEFHAALAASLAETGDYVGAVRGQKAVLVGNELDAEDKKEQEARLKLYQAKKPYRDE